MPDPYYNPEVPAHVPAELVFDFDVYAPAPDGVDFFQAFRDAQEQGAPDIFWTRHNGGHWIVGRGEPFRDVMANFAQFSAKRRMVPDSLNSDAPLRPIAVDPPEHTAFRALISPHFSPKAIAGIEASVREFAISLIEGLAPRGRCEFVADFALKMPIGVFMRLVDLPEADRAELLDLADAVVHPSGPTGHSTSAVDLIGAYLTPIAAARRARPGTDIISMIGQSQVFGRPITIEEQVDVCTLLLLGGLDTVASTLSLIARFLADHPGHRRQLIAEPALIPHAVDELLRRFPTVIGGGGRSIAEDTEFRGLTFKKGEHILVPMPFHNFDDRLFDDPMTVDFHRPKIIHSSFGTVGNPHRCPGSFLARTELNIFLKEWLSRIPDFAVAPGIEPRYHPGVNVSYEALPLVWG